MSKRTFEKLKPDFIDQLREKFASDFYFACEAIFEHHFESSWLYEPVHGSLCDEISDYKVNKRLAIILHRDWLKSTVCSVYYPTWRGILEPNFTSMLVLNTYTNAAKKLSAIRAILKDNDLLKQMYPERMPDSSCKDSEESVNLPRKSALADPTFSGCGVRTQVTSRHVNLIVEDDTIAPEQTNMNSLMMLPSDAQIEKAIGNHKVLEFILADLKKDQRIVVGTRWVERDLFTHIAEKEKFYKIISRACREDEEGNASDTGELVYPSRFDDEVLANLEATVGPYMFQALMMNDPQNPESMLFHRDHVTYYETPPKNLMIFTSVDPAGWDEEYQGDPDYNVVLTAGLDLYSGRVYVLDYWRERANPGDVVNAIIDHMTTYNPVLTLVESVAYQSTLRYWLSEAMVSADIHYRVEPSPGTKARKHDKIRALQPIVSSRRLYVRNHHEVLLHELENFPRGAHDDVIDALSMQINSWRQTQRVQSSEDTKGFELNSGDSLLEELYGRSKVKVGFPDDLYAMDLRGDRFREYYPAQN